jgi:O-antigen/teichoic acid export membrane protein
MGVILRQSLKNAAVSYVGVALGALNVLLLYPAAFSEEQFGIFQFVLKAAMMLFPFATLGVNGIVIRFFPTFRDPNKDHNGFLAYLLILLLSGLFAFVALALLLRSGIFAFYQPRFGDFTPYLNYVIPLVFLLGLANFLTNYTSNFHRIVVPAWINNPQVKLFTGGLAALVLWRVIDFDQFMIGLVGAYLVAVAGLAFYLRGLGELRLRPNPRFLDGPLRKSMYIYALYGIMGSAGSALASQIDIVMVGSMIDLSNVAAYAIAFFIADVLDVPRRAVESISAPVVAQAWKAGDLPAIRAIYQKSALNQFLIGWLLLLGIWSCIDELFLLIPNGERYAAGKYVVLILGLGRIVDLVTGVNHAIISYSRFFRFNLYAVMGLAIFNVICNLLFIPAFQINGAALATASSLLLFNGLKLAYIYFKTTLQPFTRPMLWVWLTGLACYALAMLLPTSPSPWLNIAVKAAFISLLYGAATLAFGFSPEAVNLARQWRDKLLK